jgi:hypothetical protein
VISNRLLTNPFFPEHAFSILLFDEKRHLCKEVHSKQYSRHRIGNAPVGAESDADFVEKCELSGHDNGPLKYICMSSLCQVALCSTCVVESHRDDAFHQLKELKTHVQERKDSLVIDSKSASDSVLTGALPMR